MKKLLLASLMFVGALCVSQSDAKTVSHTSGIMTAPHHALWCRILEPDGSIKYINVNGLICPQSP